MKKSMALALCLAFYATGAFAAPAWYRGTVSRVWADDPNGGFILTFSEPSSLDDCTYKYAYFRSSDLQPAQLKNALSIALSAIYSGKQVGIVIDKSQNNGYCYALSIDVRN